MSALLVTFALPNPAGKDRSASGITNAQLNNEWVEFKSPGYQGVSLNGVSLFHYTFDGGCEKTGEESVTPFYGTLAAGHSIRVHTGSGQSYQEGAVTHHYLNRGNYIWNNRCGDYVILRSGTALLDWAFYDRNPTEGRVLARVAGTNKLA